ncbi:hypothetical protein [Paenibacillus sp. IHBB 10380]|uniref:hypothetical protein n=1 Tax=Paenibacillus sp. IHBB 10380 TaxID=1566358 RepID=UPI0005D8DA53|nr:hypothetical protein [Paenibacillus sp. IHBB 10380]AJS57731.1 hypothetical protein UB51_03615 [Paenibacillus sp. IHBB 10380]
MKSKKYVRSIIYILLFVILNASLHNQNAIYAEPEPTSPTTTDTYTQKLLQDSLSIVEIDSEIQRISARQTEMEQGQQRLQNQLLLKQEQIQDQQAQAGEIIRSYYMGERDFLFASILSAKSISNLAMIYGYYEIIMEHDQTVLRGYQEQLKDIQATQKVITRNAAELKEIMAHLIQQRERVVVLHQEIEGDLATSSNPEAMKKMIEEFTLYWENIGIYEVKRHFRALAAAMNDLPQFIQKTEGAVRISGTNYSINLKEDELNEFLRSKDKLFNVFSFHFNEGSITASGQSGNLEIEITGHYSIVNEPKNGIMFHVDKLLFNKLELPDTTRQSLEEEFDLGFYPQQLISFVKATEVSVTDKNLHVTLKLSK